MVTTLTKDQEGRLKHILGLPTAPFREKFVSNAIEATLKKHSIPYHCDKWGNLFLGAHSPKEIATRAKKLKTKSPFIPLFIAHMDHPGFHGVEFKNDQLKVKWHGGAPTEKLENAQVKLFTYTGWAALGKIISFELTPTGKTIHTATIQIDSIESIASQSLQNPKATEIFGSFWFEKAVWQEGNLIYTKAADDLVGVFTILELAIRMKSKKPFPFFALLSRGEEVGFIGTLAHFSQNLWKKELPVIISLETSRQLPGAVIGKGPIVRLGDRASIFHSGYTQVLTEVARKTLGEKFQRRIMDGGTCEATAALSFGLSAIGISIPLGNYHNQSFEGGPRSRGPMGPAPEFVHLEDIGGMLSLTQAILENKSFAALWRNPWKNKKLELMKNFSEYKKFLT